MAIQERKGRASSYRVYWINPYTKRQESKSVGTLKEAEKLDALVKYQLKFEPELFRPQTAVTTPEELTFNDACFIFLKAKQFTRHGNDKRLSYWADALRIFGKKPIKDLSKEDFEKMFEEQKKRGLRQTSIAQMWASVKSVIHHCVDHDLCEPIKLPRIPQGHCRHFIPPTPDELMRMFSAAPSTTIKKIVLIGAHTGLRVGPSELFSLTWNDFDLNSSILRAKSAKKYAEMPWRNIPLFPPILPYLKKWMHEDTEKGFSFVFHTSRGNPISEVSRCGWRKMLKGANIDRWIRPYDLRHFFATELLAAGENAGVVASLMGHADTVMVFQHYQHVSAVQTRQAIQHLPNLFNLPNGSAQ